MSITIRYSGVTMPSPTVGWQNLTLLIYGMMDIIRDTDPDDPQFNAHVEDIIRDIVRNSNTSGADGADLSLLNDMLGSDVIIGSDDVTPDSMGYIHMRPYIYGSLLVFVSLLGVIMHIVAITIIAQKHRRCASPIHVLYLNLIAACLVFIVGGMPLLLVENIFGYGWDLGEPACQVHRYLIHTTFYAIGYAICAILMYLLLLTSMPHKMEAHFGARSASFCCFLLWSLILVCNIPNYLGHGVSDEMAGISYCYHKDIHEDPDKVRAWTILQFVFTFAIPFSVMGLTSVLLVCRLLAAPPGDYSRLQEYSAHSSRDMALIAVCLSLTFGVCWAPDKILSLILALEPRRMEMQLLIVNDVLMCVSYISPSLYPLVILFGVGSKRRAPPRSSGNGRVPKTLRINSGSVRKTIVYSPAGELDNFEEHIMITSL